MVEFPQWNNFGSYFSDKSEKKAFIIFQVYLSLSSDQEIQCWNTIFNLLLCFVSKKNLQQKTRNLQHKTRNLQQVLWADILWSNMDKIRKPR